ncbi:unnamed protein product [Meloidogyne enterolobii]|uniref:Uncharacterized protein n=1 Tax=Meloidogyne enterolobii TaxID=390850 RepID=A0ACB0ZHW7_MELEN
MIKLIIFSCFSLINLLNIKSDGMKVSILVKIKDDWQEKREFIYLKNVELEERFVLEKIERKYKYACSLKYNIEGFLCRIDVNHERNNYKVEIHDRSDYAEELKRKVLINIAKNKFIQNIHPGSDNQVF